jgi:hypothetical protein
MRPTDQVLEARQHLYQRVNGKLVSRGKSLRQVDGLFYLPENDNPVDIVALARQLGVEHDYRPEPVPVTHDTLRARVAKKIAPQKLVGRGAARKRGVYLVDGKPANIVRLARSLGVLMADEYVDDLFLVG